MQHRLTQAGLGLDSHIWSRKISAMENWLVWLTSSPHLILFAQEVIPIGYFQFGFFSCILEKSLRRYKEREKMAHLPVCWKV